FEITPSSMIGFLTILGYSLYDTVVVFDKVRENTAEAFVSRRRTYTQAANLAVNQTVVRSVNTTVVALLPIAAILVVGFTLLGPGTLLDLSLALFVGIAVGAYSSIFIATPLLVDLRRGETAVRDLDKAALRTQAKDTGKPASAATPSDAAARPGRTTAARPAATAVLDRRDPSDEVDPDAADAPVEVTDGSPREDAPRAPTREVHKWAAKGPRNQPSRPPKSKR
ncbi:MAG: protein translocase subunit SecF, partial [Lapillicoccus sp.]